MPRSLFVPLVAICLSGIAAANPVPRPNVVLILADDLGRIDLGCYGGRSTRTPNIDRLATEGMRFDAAFVTASSCSPSRASLITGRYPHRTDAEQLHWPLPQDQVTFVESLRSAGYWTAAAGKWHLGEHAKSRFDLVKEADPSGFQLPSGSPAAATLHATGDGSGCEEWVAALQARPKDKPFFLWLAALDPHRDYFPGAIEPPHSGDEIDVPPYLPDVPEVRGDFALYRDEVTRLDAYVGKLLEELARQGLADDTAVIFLSDNGRPFPREKTTLYDAGIATPLIVRWPGHAKPGSASEALVSSIDLAPTILRMAGIEPGPTFDGQSLLPLLERPEGKVNDFVFAEDHWHDFEDHARAVRSGRYKLIRNDYPDLPNTPPADALRSPTFAAMRQLRSEGKLTPAQLACFVTPRPVEEFYDLQADPHELTNLAADPHVVKELETHRKALANWSERTADALPARRTPDEFDRDSGAPLPNRVPPRPSKARMLIEPPASANGGSAWDRIAPYFSPPQAFANDLGPYLSLLTFDDGRPVTNAAEWKQRREEILKKWHSDLGEWPDVNEHPQVTYSNEAKEEGYTRHNVRFEFLPGLETSGYLLVPDAIPAGIRRPAVLVVYYEPETGVGLKGEHRDFARQLARRGFVTLSVGHDYSIYYPNRDAATLQPLSALACAAANAFHVLATRDDVDPNRIGVTGHSYGGKWSMFASCLYDRFACAAWSDGGIVFDESRSNVNYWEPWYLGYDGPMFRKRGLPTDENPRTGLYPRLLAEGRDLHELHALMAPRPFLVSGGSEDPPERWRALNHAVAVNRLLGNQDRVGMTNRPTHAPTPESNEQLCSFFEHFLQEESK